MKFYDLQKQPLQIPELETEYQAAKKITPAAIGPEHLFFRSGLKTLVIPYTDVTRIFRRVRACHTSLGCCGGDLNTDYLVLCNDSGELAEIEFSNENFTKSALETLKALLPGMAFGKE